MPAVAIACLCVGTLLAALLSLAWASRGAERYQGTHQVALAASRFVTCLGVIAISLAWAYSILSSAGLALVHRQATEASQIFARYGVRVPSSEVSDLPAERGQRARDVVLPVSGSHQACTVTLLTTPVVTCANGTELPRARRSTS